MDVTLNVPDHTTLSKRAKGLKIYDPDLIRSNEPIVVALDSTGLKVYGAGEWSETTLIGIPCNKVLNIFLYLCTFHGVNDPVVMESILNTIWLSRKRQNMENLSTLNTVIKMIEFHLFQTQGSNISLAFKSLMLLLLLCSILSVVFYGIFLYFMNRHKAQAWLTLRKVRCTLYMVLLIVVLANALIHSLDNFIIEAVVFILFIFEYFGFCLTEKIKNSGKNLSPLHVINEEENLKLRIDSAIQTTRMIAHDVKRPISMTLSTLNVLERIENINEFKEKLHQYKFEITKQLRDMNVLFQSIMEIDPTAHLKVESVSISQLLYDSIKETFLNHSSVNYEFGFDMVEHHLVKVDAIQMKKVFSILIQNAIEADGQDGNLLFSVSEMKDKKNGVQFLQLTIKNNSIIPSKVLEKIFFPFFTTKKNGHFGLGTTFAKMVMKSYGGDLVCRSIEGFGTNFIISLPISEEKDDSTLVWPISSSQFKLINQDFGVGQKIIDLATLPFIGNAELDILLGNFRGFIKILVVDDESIYSKAIEAVLKGSLNQSKIQIQSAMSSNQVLEIMEQWVPDFILMDVQLGPHSINGFDLSRKLRQKGFENLIFMHTNFNLNEVRKEVENDQINGLLAKPAAIEDLMKIICKICKEKQKIEHVNSSELCAKEKHLIVIDDNIILLEDWSGLDVNLKSFLSPLEFLNEIQDKKDILDGCFAIVIDYYFDNCVEWNGVALAKELLCRGIQVPIFIASDAILNEGDFPSGVKKIDKNPEIAWRIIKSSV